MPSTNSGESKWKTPMPQPRNAITPSPIVRISPPTNRTTLSSPEFEFPIMTGRQLISPVAASVRTDGQNDLKQLRIHDGNIETPVKTHKKTVAKSTRPAMELYSVRKVAAKNGSKVHFVDQSPPKSVSLQVEVLPPPKELKSALKRSKSFTYDETREQGLAGFEREAFPQEYQGLIKQAVLDPNSLTCQKLMELVRLICSKAVESVEYAEPAAKLCFSIIEKEHEHTFLESLQNCCREWFNEREKLLRASFPANLRRWTAFVSFVTELYRQVKCMVAMTLSQKDGAKGVVVPHPNSPVAHLALTLQTLLFDCAGVIVKKAALNSEVEMEILRKMLYSVGKQLEHDSSVRMSVLVTSLRDAFLSPAVTAQTRKTLLEAIELYASGWELDQPQVLYYFPYTKV